MTSFSIVCRDEQEAALRAPLFGKKGLEGAAYVLFREARIKADPWTRSTHVKLLVREVIPIDPVSASGVHVTWDTASFVGLLQRAQREELILGIAHSHPEGFDNFSSQDDENEAELFRTASVRNGHDVLLVSMLFTATGGVKARVWQYPKHQSVVRSVTVIGERFQFHLPDAAPPTSPAFARQVLAFGPTLVHQLKNMRVGVVGAGGTGSATIPLLARAGVGQLIVFDDDIVEASNLNRLHGATQADADAMRSKIDIAIEQVARMGLGTRIVGRRGWANNPENRDALKACDVIFGCTDDHSGRMFLNRLAYFYLEPVFDMGLAMAVSPEPTKGMADISARVTTVMPPETCLLCRGAVDLEAAREEDLRRQRPEEFERSKREAYVRGEGNPNPAVVTFTTEVATMAVNEFLNRIIGYRRKSMGAEIRRRFLFCEDRATNANSRSSCPICSDRDYWGLGDVEPFLDVVG